MEAILYCYSGGDGWLGLINRSLINCKLSLVMETSKCGKKMSSNVIEANDIELISLLFFR